MSKQMIIGITGGIGSGKSVVTAYLRRLGYIVICADEVSWQIVKPGQPGNDAIRQSLGDAFFNDDGTLCRKKLAAFVFTDKERVALLNSILHPLIVKRIFDQAVETGGLVFIDAALLIQADMQTRTDRVWVVVVDKKTRIRRVTERDGCSASDVIQRIDSQMSDDDMSAYADVVIDNSGSIDALYTQIDMLLGQLEHEEGTI